MGKTPAVIIVLGIIQIIILTLLFVFFRNLDSADDVSFHPTLKDAPDVINWDSNS